MYVQSQRLCSVKGPGCVLTGVNVRGAYIQAMLAEASHPLVFFEYAVNQTMHFIADLEHMSNIKLRKYNS